MPDTELVLCVNEVMPNAGGWCLKGQQPVFASTTNQEAPLLPFAHWMPKLRDWDLWGPLLLCMVLSMCVPPARACAPPAA